MSKDNEFDLVASDITIPEIGRIATRSHALSIRDRLSPEPENSRVEISLAEYNEQKQLIGHVSLKLSPDALKLIAYDIVNRAFESETIQLPFANPQGGGVILRGLRLSRKKEQWSPYLLEMSDGLGERTANGYKVSEVKTKVIMTMDEKQTRCLFLAIYDYIRDWETVNFRRRQEALSIVIPRKAA